MTWQPIETAPKDGTVILIYAGNSVSAAYWALATSASGWDDEKYPWCFLDSTNGLNGFQDSLECGPTHWMPLPEPPQN